MGSRNKPLQLTLDARSLGPALEFAVGAKPTEEPAAGSSGQGPLSAVSSVKSLSPEKSNSRASFAPISESSSRSAGNVGKPSQTSRASRSAASLKGKGVGSDAGSIAEVPVCKSPWASTAAINFGKVAVLQPHVQQLRIHNPTVIQADFKLFIESSDSSFEVNI